MQNRLADVYFDWLCSIVCGSERPNNLSFRKVLAHLHRTAFLYSIEKDRNRYSDGIELRYRFSLGCDKKYPYEYIMENLNGPCSVLEMMVALSIRCEENIMDNPEYGDRTGQWFWGMMRSLGLNSMWDQAYDAEKVDNILDTFLNRCYEPNGSGGLFTIRGCKDDLRYVEIWYQLMWYLNTIA